MFFNWSLYLSLVNIESSILFDRNCNNIQCFDNFDSRISYWFSFNGDGTIIEFITYYYHQTFRSLMLWTLRRRQLQTLLYYLLIITCSILWCSMKRAEMKWWKLTSKLNVGGNYAGQTSFWTSLTSKDHHVILLPTDNDSDQLSLMLVNGPTTTANRNSNQGLSILLL